MWQKKTKNGGVDLLASRIVSGWEADSGLPEGGL
jgi:hypothetical protein